MRNSDTILDVAHLDAGLGPPYHKQVRTFADQLRDVEGGLMPHDDAHVFVRADKPDEHGQVLQPLLFRRSILEIVDYYAATHRALLAGLLVVHHGREAVEVFETGDLREHVGRLEDIILLGVSTVLVNYVYFVKRGILMDNEVER